jgi:hypothetical protein
MRQQKLGAVLALSALALGACHGRMTNSAICAKFNASGGQTTTTGLATADAATPVDECLRRWAYSLASSRDDADTVAEATVAACSAQLSRWGQNAVSAPQGDEGVSLTTGQPTNPLAEHNAFARGRAVLYVVQARAGRCAPPPVTNGAPAGVS